MQRHDTVLVEKKKLRVPSTFIGLQNGRKPCKETVHENR